MDIIILSLKEKKEIGKFYEGFYIEKIKDETGYNEYCFDSYKILNSFDGYFYNIFSEKSYSNGDIIAGSYDIFDYMDSKKPEYVLEDSKDKNFNETIKRNPYLSLKLKNGYKNKFKKLLIEFLECSEVEACVFLVRQPIENPEKIIGPINVQKFFDLLDENKIYMNFPYIISK